jgi:LasA protease
MNRKHSRRMLIPIAALTLAALSCARADVTSTGAIGSGALPSATAGEETPETIPEPSPTLTSLPPTAVPVTPEPVASPTFPSTPTAASGSTVETILYYAQTGDTLHNVAVRYGVLPEEIESPGFLPGASDLIDAGQLLVIPRRLGETGPSVQLIPDSELVFSPHATDFDTVGFARSSGGFLTEYKEVVGGMFRSGAEVVDVVALNNSVNPRILLAILEYQSGWVTNPERPDTIEFKFPLGKEDSSVQGLQRQLTWLSNELGNGYFGWRAGTLTEITFPDRTTLRLSPDLNAGTVALQYYFAQFLDREEWTAAVGEGGFIQTYKDLFGEPWVYEYPLYEPGIEQPALELPFLPGHVWAFTGGPHGAWERESAWAALDFAPSMSEPGCAISDDWIVASAPGIVVRSENGIVVVDLDGDGREQSGWALLYLHVAERDRVENGTLLETGDLIGHPSCEGGIATGTHLHMARKYNGEWILADGPMPFKLSGWVARAGIKPYQGVLVKDGEEVVASPLASRGTNISR